MKQKHSTQTILFGVLCLVVGVVLLVMACWPLPVELTVRGMYLAGSILGFIEGYALLNDKHNDTISHKTRAYCAPRPWLILLILVFVCLLMGHFFLDAWIWAPPVFVK